ncbi:hypothetical protein CEXT_144311 [Caerostris extrusa]|uniref:Uncharacterized protein n=1 Tax=Caerostris extrusa TaxID=172846 RepID=A0AAV4Y7S1_CAEEX|nr:hypothetical protein CEXT_144311 [Caerostris extrusa]
MNGCSKRLCLVVRLQTSLDEKGFLAMKLGFSSLTAWITTEVMPAKDRVKEGSSCTGSHSLPGMQMDLMPDEWLLKASLFSDSRPLLMKRGFLR